jgi:hypothetical protein
MTQLIAAHRRRFAFFCSLLAIATATACGDAATDADGAAGAGAGSTSVAGAASGGAGAGGIGVAGAAPGGTSNGGSAAGGINTGGGGAGGAATGGAGGGGSGGANTAGSAMGGAAGTGGNGSPGGPVLHIFMLMGQSNMAGVAMAQASDKNTDERLKVWGGCNQKAAQWNLANPPLSDCPGGSGINLSTSVDPVVCQDPAEKAARGGHGRADRHRGKRREDRDVHHRRQAP